MNHRLQVIFYAFAFFVSISLSVLKFNGWPERSFVRVFEEVDWVLMTISWFIGVVFLIVGLVLSSGQGGAPMGTIGTERPEDYPDPGLSKSYRGGSFAIAGALLLLVGTSVCFGNGWF